jgi:hypothetical protein
MLKYAFCLLPSGCVLSCLPIGMLSMVVLFGWESLGLFQPLLSEWSLFLLLRARIFRASNTYVLRQDGLEVRRGIIRLHSFVVTPSGFGDLMLYQSVGGRIFGYGDLTVNSQGERETKLLLVLSPFKVAETIRDIMGKPIVRVEGHF